MVDSRCLHVEEDKMSGFSTKIDWKDVAARSSAATMFDVDGDVVITRGSAIFRVRIGATPCQVPVLGQLSARQYRGHSFLSSDEAQVFLKYIAPYVRRKKAMVHEALRRWDDREQKKYEYLRFVKYSARPLPGKTC